MSENIIKANRQIKRSYLRILHSIFKRIKVYQILTTFFIVSIICAGIITATDPKFHDEGNYWDALWYIYQIGTTVGLGDFCPIEPLSRILSVFITFYATVVIAILTGAIVSFYQEIVTRQINNSKEALLYDLEHLPELSKEELTELSEKIKKYDSNSK